jgi:hypothetical protein
MGTKIRNIDTLNLQFEFKAHSDRFFSAIRGWADMNRDDVANAPSRTVEELQKEYGNKFRIVGSAALREKALGVIGVRFSWNL